MHSLSRLAPVSAPASLRPRRRQGDSEVVPMRRALDLDGAMAAWARGEPRPRLLVTEEMALIWADPRIETMALGDYGLSLRTGRLTSTGAPAHQLLQAFVADLGGELGVATFPSERGPGGLVMRGRRVDHEGRRLLGLELEREGDEASYCYVGVRQAFGLTCAEERVLQKLLQGRTATMVAEELEISLETARTHIRQAYAKIGANCREALFHRLRAYRVG